jgi:hypothetical protein
MPGWPTGDEHSAGHFDPEFNLLELNEKYAQFVEHTLSGSASNEIKETTFMRFYMSVTHEVAHRVNTVDFRQNLDGEKSRDATKITITKEDGLQFEEQVWGYDNFKPDSNPKNVGVDGIQGIRSEKYRSGVTEGIIQNAKKTTEGSESLPTVPKP